MKSSLEDEIQDIVVSMDNDEQNGQEQRVPRNTKQEKEPEEIIHIHYFPDAIVILKEDADRAQVVESAPVTHQKISFMPAFAISIFYFFLVFSCIVFQAYEIWNPPIVTITILPKSQTVALTGTLQLGRELSPLTISQLQTVPTTGKGHQDARSATGFITLYNGLFTSQTIQAGTIITGTDGLQVVTDQEAIIPAGNPPSYGHVTVSAHTINPGVKGNIPAYDINQACCSNAILAKNKQSFSGGLDERNYQTLAKADIARVATPLKTAVAQSMSGALQGQLNPNEQLFILPCTPIQTSDHPIGAAATQVKVTMSETCSAFTYNSQKLEQKAADLLNRQAATKIGTSYSLIGVVTVTVNQATITHTPHPLVFLSFHASGTWIYALSHTAQQQIKSHIAGKTKQGALHDLSLLPGIERASILWGDDTKLPKDSSYIHFVMLINAV